MTGIIYETTCPICGGNDHLHMEREQLIRWSVGGELIQNVFPTWSASKRELLITGICKSCWDESFGEGE